MKRSLVGVSFGLLATVLLADPVTSINRVGFNKQAFEKGKLYLVSTAFEDIDGQELNAASVLGGQLPNGTQISYFKGTGATPYISDVKTAAQGWSANVPIQGVMGFWVKVPNGPAIASSYDVMVKGQVPMQSSVSVPIASGLNMLGYPYTADIAFADTQLCAASGPGDELHIYNSATTNYQSFAKGFAGWTTAAKSVVLKQGEGFWYKRAGAAFLDVEPRPYASN